MPFNNLLLLLESSPADVLMNLFVFNPVDLVLER